MPVVIRVSRLVARREMPARGPEQPLRSDSVTHLVARGWTSSQARTCQRRGSLVRPPGPGGHGLGPGYGISIVREPGPGRLWPECSPRPDGLMIFPMHGAEKTTDAYLSIPNDRVPHLDQVVSCSSRTRDCALPEDCLGYLIKYLDLKSLVSLHFSKVAYMSAIFRSLS